jgi:hypothetical protein
MKQVRSASLKVSCVVVCLVGMFLVVQAWACDVAVVSGRVTTDGHPLIWKNFDNSSSANQQVTYFPARKASAGGYLMVYRYEDGMRLLTGSSITPSAGVNEAGFAAACTSVYQDYNITAEPVNLNTALLQEALATCATLADFEKLLRNWPYYHLGTVISANFVVIDAQGGAALYECFTGHLNKIINPMMFKKYDANTGRVVNQSGYQLKAAQSGFIGFYILTNYNSYIPWNVGQDRKQRAEYLLAGLANGRRLDYRTVMREVAKDVAGKQVNTRVSSETNYSTVYCISRNATRSGVVVRGVAKGQDPRLVTFWCNLGEPSVGVFVPFFAGAKGASHLAYIDSIENGVMYDDDDSCLLNQAISFRETYGELIYKYNEGDPINGMYDNYINKVELAKVQAWTFPIEDAAMDNYEDFQARLMAYPALCTAANLKAFSDYCAQYEYDNYVSASAWAVLWSYVMP